MYASRATGEISSDDLSAILRKSKANNPEQGITGVLCYSEGVFLQVLEGGRAAISALYNKIINDPRHRDVMLLSFEEIAERGFASWSMGQVNLQRVNPALLLKYSDTAELDPFSMPAAFSLALFKELIATALIMGQA
jgi:hypothetical protein